MSLDVFNNTVVVTKGMFVNVYNIVDDEHIVFNIPLATKPEQKDYIQNVAISADTTYYYIALMTSSSKRLMVYDMTLSTPKCFVLPRAASKIRFTRDSNIIVADKTGDVLHYSLKNQTKEHAKLLGHLSLLLDVLQSEDGKFIITADRDEKIRVTHYPNTYNIQSYCLGHKEFVNHIEFLPHNKKFLISTSGDGSIKIWDYVNGKLNYNIDTYEDMNDEQLCTTFIQSMDKEAVEVIHLPIVHFASTCLAGNRSVLAVSILSINKILIYTVESQDEIFSHKLEQIIDLGIFPSAIKFNKLLLFIYSETESYFELYHLEKCEKILFILMKRIVVFDNTKIDIDKSEYDTIKILYKRRYDNILEYQERKRKRLNEVNKR